MSTEGTKRAADDDLFAMAFAALLRARTRAEDVARATGTCLIEAVDGKPVRVPPPPRLGAPLVGPRMAPYAPLVTAAPAILPLPLDMLEHAIAQQPASVRADFAWLPKVIREAFARLQKEPLEPGLVNDVAATFFTAMRRVGPVVADLTDPLWDDTRSGIATRVASLREALDDDEAADALEWAWRQLDAMFEAFAAMSAFGKVARDAVHEGEEDVRAMLATEGGSFVRAEVLILACIEGAESGAEPATLRELAWYAFEQMCKAQDAFAAEGLALTLQHEGAAASSVLRAVEGIRKNLTAADMKQLRAARMHALR